MTITLNTYPIHSERRSERLLPGPNLALLIELLSSLSARGLQVPGCEDFATRALIERPAPVLDWGTDVMTLTPDQVNAKIEQHALNQMLAEGPNLDMAYTAYQKAMCEAAAEAIRAHADQLVGGLNAELAPHMSKAAALRAAGVKATDTAVEVVKMAPATIQMWNEFEPTAHELDALAELRFGLSRIALVSPGMRTAFASGAMWSACFTKPVVYDRPNEPIFHRWLRLAANPDLAFSKPSEISDVQLLAVEGVRISPDKLESIAAGRAAEAPDSTTN